MSITSIIKALFSLLANVSRYLADKQLIDAGVAKAALSGKRSIDKAVKKAKEARDNALDEHDPDSWNRDND